MMLERPRCTQCALHLGATCIKVKSRGSDKPLLLFVGEAPGRDEDRTGECFVGAAGQEFDRLLDLAGIDFKYCRWTNVVRCVPWGDRPRTRTPGPGEIEACSAYLEGEILNKDPVFIVTLGNTALHALVPKAPLIGKARKQRHFIELPSLRSRYRKAVLWARTSLPGISPPSVTTDKGMKQFVQEIEAYGGPHEETKFFTVYPTYHPSASIRNKETNQAIELAIIEDLGYLRTQVTGDRGIPFDSYEYLSTLGEIRDHLEYVKQLYLAGKIPAACIDLETTGLSPYLTLNAKVVLFSIAYGEGKAFSIPFDHHESPFANDMLAKRAIVAMVQDFLEVVPTVNHNYKFDLHWLAFMGIDISKVKVVGDSMLSSWTLWNDTIQDHSLEALATRHVGMIAHKEEMDQAKQDAYLRLLDEGEERQPTMDDIELEIVHKYCCADTDSCLRLWAKFESLMITEGLYDPHHQVCVPAIVPTAAMEIAGVRCDLALLVETQKELEQQLSSYYEQLADWNLDVEILKALNIKAMHKGKSKAVVSYKLTAPAAKSALIFDVLGFEPKEYGKSGPSVDKGVIGNLMELCTANMVHDDGGEWSFKLKVLDLVRSFNATHTLLSRYIKPIPQYVDKKSICHSNFGIRTTRTGRYNSQKPSFHQMPWRCASGETTIKLLDGTEHTLEDLALEGGYHWFYSVSSEGHIIPGGPARVVESGTKAPLIKVTLDSGKSERFTPEHLWILRDGSEKCTRDLKPGDSLMPLYYDTLGRGDHEEIYVPALERWVLTHTIVASHKYGCYPERREDGSRNVVHHSNFDKLDNSPDNIVVVNDKEHRRLHASHAAKERWKDPLQHEAQSACMSRMLTELWQDEDYKAQKSAEVSASNLRRVGIEYNKNHKVVSVEPAGIADKVYDVVDCGPYNNFALASGVFVHNSAVKSSFQPHHPYGLILSADYSQMELRVLAAVTQDPDMMAAFISGQDIHRLIASMVLNKPPEEVLTAERRRIKTVVFGICYGRSARSIAVQEHISEAAAQELIDKFFYRFPRVKEWVKKQHAYAKKHGKVYSPFGFTRLLESYLSDYERNNRAVNTPIQGSASDIGICGMRNVYRLLTRKGSPFKTTMFAQVHDSLLFSTYPGEIFDVLTICKKGMVDMPPREIPWLTVPIRVDFEIGPSWGELIEVKVLDDRQILFEKATPVLYDRMCEIFMAWDDPPELISSEKVLELEDGSQLYQSLSSVKIREAVKEEFYNSTWQFPQFIQAA